MLIVNMYNDNAWQEALKQSLQVIRRRAREANSKAQWQHLIWLGDFNLHHPLSDEERNSHLFTRNNLDKAQWLIDATAELNLQMVLPRGTPMVCIMSTGNYTCPDNVFISASLCGAVTKCHTVPEEWPARADHMPIVTFLETGPECQTKPPRLNYWAAEWDAVRDELSARLNELDAEGSISTEVEFYSRLNKLTQAITGMIDAKVPKVRPSPYQKWWWSKELSTKQK